MDMMRYRLEFPVVLSAISILSTEIVETQLTDCIIENIVKLGLLL